MIGSLRGVLLDRNLKGEVLVEVGGVGYRVVVSAATLAQLGEQGMPVFLHTHLHVRDDALVLYGFLRSDERACFQALLGAHGVGPSLALAILSVHTPIALRRAVAEGDADALTLVAGVGKKTAARLLLELKARLEVPELEVDLAAPTKNGHAADATSSSNLRAELRAALVGLGFGPDEVSQALRELPLEGDLEAMLRQALAVLGGGSVSSR